MDHLSGETEQFIKALGVRVERVPDLDGDCATYVKDRHMLILCDALCPGRGERALARLLAKIS